MTWRHTDHDDGPEPLPPEELLRHRQVLVTPASPDVRAHHVSAAAAESRRLRAAVTAQTIARRSARVIAGVAATIVVSSSLAGASIITEPARSMFPAMTDRFLPRQIEEPADDADDVDLKTVRVPETTEARPPSDKAAGAGDRDAPRRSTTTEGIASASADDPKPSTTPTTKKPSSTTTSTEPDRSTTTTEPDPSSTTTTEPDPSSTTTTEPDPSSTTTTEPGPSSTTTTVATSSTKRPPAHATGDGGGR